MFIVVSNIYSIYTCYRFRVKLSVDDGTAKAVFVVFDSDMHAMLGKHCFELVAESKVYFYVQCFLFV
jgi:hypothetical protein